jgi:cytochrome c peroxidase
MKMSPHTAIGALVGLSLACGPQLAERTMQVAEPLTGEEMLLPVVDQAGTALTVTSTGTIDTTNEYFLSLGTNGRTCGSCHLAEQGWSITPAGLNARFEASAGLDPIFRPHDGANAPNLDVSTVEARRAAYSLMLSRGVVRVGLPVKATSEFILVAADDPYGWASATQLSMFRRPLPTTNLQFLTVINWDGRNTPALDLTNIRLGLKNQSNGATVNHAQALPLTDAVRESIVTFESSLTTAQAKHDQAGSLDAAGATGGPVALRTQPFAPGMNDPAQPGFSNHVFSLFDAWSGRNDSSLNSARQDIADGQRVFNEKTFDTGNGRTGTCSGCHSLPNVGSASTFRFFDVGISDASRRAANVPLYTFQNILTGETVQTTDAGRALISGKWADMNRFKVPGLRGLAARAPYFHDGSAKSIGDVVNHYQQRFGIDFSNGEKNHLVMFLESL